MVASSVIAEPGGKIVIRNVVKSFPHNDGSIVPALSGINLDIAPGEFVSLIGPSGCGKTTLLRLVTGLISPDVGDITVDGEAIRGPDCARGLVFQNPLLFPWLNIHDNVSFGLRARRIYREKKGEVEAFLKLVGLERFGRSYPHQLSGGMAQRASLARALVNHPRVLLMDEPLGALDAFTRMNMQEEIVRIWQERKTTMVMVTHDVDEAIYLSDMVVVMSPGPARIETVLDVSLARPRARSDPDFLLLRTRILKILDFGGQPGEPNYMI